MRKKILLNLSIIMLLLTITGCGTNNTLDNNENANNSITENQQVENNVVGKWNTTSAVNAEDGKKTEDLRSIFGSSYSQYGSYIELKEDGTFTDAIRPITNGTKSNTGTYKVVNNYNKPNDCYIFLTYTDGNESKLKDVIIDDSNTHYLVLEELVDGYQLYLKKD